MDQFQVKHAALDFALRNINPGEPRDARAVVADAEAFEAFFYAQARVQSPALPDEKETP